MNKGILVLIILGWSLEGMSINGVQELFINRINHYNTENGLSSDNIYHIERDKNGMLWFSSDRGISVFNGQHLKNYNQKHGLTDDEVLSTHQDENGIIWFATYNGKISKYNKGEFSAIESKNVQPKFGPIKTLKNFSQMLLVIPVQGSSWLFDKKRNKWQAFNEGDHADTYLDIIQDSATGEVIIIGKNEVNRDEIFIQRGKELIRAKGKYFDATYYNRKSDRLYLLKKNNQGKVELEVYFTKQLRLMQTIELEKLEDESPITMEVLNKQLIVGTRNGLFILNAESGQLRAHSLENYTVSSFIQYSDGNYWIGTLEGGVFQVEISTTKRNLDYSPVYRIVESKGRLFGCGEGKVVEYLGAKNCRIYDVSKSREKITDIEVIDNKTILAVSGAGAFIISGKSVYQNYFSGGLKDIISIHDSLYIGAYNGIYKWSRNDIKKLQYLPEKLISDRANTLIEIDDVLYFGNEKGLFSYDFNTISKIDVQSGRVNRILKINESICYNVSSNGLKLVGPINNHFLLNETIHQINQSDNKIIAILNERLAMVKLGEMEVVFPKTFTKGRINDAYIVDSFLLVATSSGTYIVRLAELEENGSLTKPKILLERILLKGNELKGIKNILFDSDQNDFTFYFNSVCFDTKSELIFEYSLENFSTKKRFKGTSSSGQIYLYDLAGGEYEFKVWVKASEQYSEVNSYRFVIQYPLTQRWWFFLVISVLLLLLFIIVYRARLKYYRIEQQRTKALYEYEQASLRAKMNPHFLFNVLNSIQQYFLKDEGLNGHKYLKKFAELVRQVLNNTDKTIVTVSEEIDYLKKYVELEQLRSNIAFDFKISLSESNRLLNCKIPSMMIQPFIENSIWHAFDSSIDTPNILLSFRIQANNLIIEIEDNGKGFTLGSKNKNPLKVHGIDIVKQRIEVLRKYKKQQVELVISSEINQGTKIFIRVPVDNDIK